MNSVSTVKVHDGARLDAQPHPYALPQDVTWAAVAGRRHRRARGAARSMTHLPDKAFWPLYVILPILYSFSKRFSAIFSGNIKNI